MSVLTDDGASVRKAAAALWTGPAVRRNGRRRTRVPRRAEGKAAEAPRGEGRGGRAVSGLTATGPPSLEAGKKEKQHHVWVPLDERVHIYTASVVECTRPANTA